MCTSHLKFPSLHAKFEKHWTKLSFPSLWFCVLCRDGMGKDIKPVTKVPASLIVVACLWSISFDVFGKEDRKQLSILGNDGNASILRAGFNSYKMWQSKWYIVNFFTHLAGDCILGQFLIFCCALKSSQKHQQKECNPCFVPHVFAHGKSWGQIRPDWEMTNNSLFPSNSGFIKQ